MSANIVQPKSGMSLENNQAFRHHSAWHHLHVSITGHDYVPSGVHLVSVLQLLQASHPRFTYSPV